MRKIKHGKMSGGCSDSCCLKLEGVSVHIQGEDILEDVSFHLQDGVTVYIYRRTRDITAEEYRAISDELTALYPEYAEQYRSPV